jgi:hypothetical protein
VEVRIVSELSALAQSIGLALTDGSPKAFLRGDTVMKIDYDPNLGVPTFIAIKPTEFVTWVEQYVVFVKRSSSEDGGEIKRSISLQSKFAQIILDSPQFKACLPRVRRVNCVRLPTLRPPSEEHPGGKLELLPEGFDELTGIYTFATDVKVDETWTIERAIAYELQLYAGFPLPLVSRGDQLMQCPRAMAACIASRMSIFAEGLLPPNSLRCGFIFTANMQGSGKSLLGKMVMAPVTGQPAGLPWNHDDGKLKDMVDSALLGGQGVIFFDNVKGYIESHILEALMTLSFWKGRVFSTQRVFTVKNETTVLISGNNAKPSPDLERRFIFIELFHEGENRQHEREIDDQWLMDSANRSDMLSSLYAFVRHWASLGRPGVTKWVSGFRSWSDIVGGIVATAMEPSQGAIGNPLEAPELISAGNQESKHLRRLVDELVTQGLRTRVIDAMKGEDVTADPPDDMERTAVVAAARARGLSISKCEFTPIELTTVAMIAGLFDWFLPELPEGKSPGDVIKKGEQIKLGKMLTDKTGEYPKGVKYAIDGQLWRLSWRGHGRARRYIVEQVER